MNLAKNSSAPEGHRDPSVASGAARKGLHALP